VVDGDRNGEIGVSDVTPIGQNFGVRCQGYRLYYSTEVVDVPQSAAEANGAGTQQVTELPVSEATGAPAERKLFSYSPAETPPEGYYWVRPYDGQVLGTPSNAWLLGAANQPPIAVLQGEPDEGLFPLTVAFSAFASIDIDGTIVNYEWDFDGPLGGEDWLDTGTKGYIEHTFADAGDYLPTVRVTDDDGASDVDILPVQVRKPRPPTAVLEVDLASGPTPLEVLYDASASFDIDGPVARYEWDFDQSGDYTYDSGPEPAAMFYYYEPGTYRTSVRVTDDDGLVAVSAGVEVTVDLGAEWHDVIVPTADVAWPLTALAEVAGTPAIAHGTYISEVPDSDLTRYIRANDPKGATWADPVIIREDRFDSLALAVADGRPAIAGSNGSGDVMYVRAEDSTGASWPEPTSSALSGGGDVRLALVGGLPALCRATTYVRALDLAGEAWGMRVDYATGAFSAAEANPALSVVAERPAVSYYVNGRLAYVRADDAAGQGWSVSTVIDDQDSAAGGSRLLVVGGRPAIAYYYPTLGTLKFVRALDAEGSAWGDAQVLALAVVYDAPLGLILVDDRPAILYKGQDVLHHLQCLIANDPAGASWSFPMQIGALLGSSEGETCFALVDGGPAVSATAGGGDERRLHYAAYY
jgi:PKD repeat protein